MWRKLQVHFVLLFVNLIYGANYIIAKEVMPTYIRPFGFILVRVTAALVLFLAAHYLLVREKVEKKDILRLMLCGAFGVAANQLLFFKGLDLTTPINASLIMITTPMLVLLLSFLILKERVTLAKASGIGLGAAGAFLIIFWGKQGHVSGGSLGDLLVFLNAASYAVYLVIVRPLMLKYHPFTVVKWVFFFGLLFIIPIGYKEVTMVNWESLSLPIWLSVAYVIVFTTFIAYSLNVFALGRVNSSVVGSYIYLQPFFATFIALMFNKDELTWIKVLASLMIFAGVYLVSFHMGSKPVASAKN